MFLNVAMPSLAIAGLPLRGLCAVAALGFVALQNLDVLQAIITRNREILCLTGALALIGIFVSFVNGTPIPDITRAVTEIHIQTAVAIVAAGALATLCGARAALIAILTVVGVSGLVAVLQMIGVESAWNLRAALGSAQQQVMTDMESFVDRRPMGLAYSPIEIATHMCLAFAAFAAVRERLARKQHAKATSDPLIFVALFVFAIICIASATRSPLLGASLFLVIYTFGRRGGWLPIAVGGGAAVLYFAWPTVMGMFQDMQARVVRVDDTSATGRWTLAYFGTRLFLDNPLGYGFNFKPWEHWTSYWAEIYTMPAALNVTTLKLHNYLLNMLNIYGIGITLVLPTAARLLYRARRSLVFFVPYIVHIIFHNTGPLYNDVLLWFVVAAIAAAEGTSVDLQQPRRRAFRYRMASPVGDPAANLDLPQLEPPRVYGRLRSSR